MKILLTGAQGQLAQALAAALGDHELTPVGHRQLDIGDLAAVRDVLGWARPELVVNAAAFNDVDGAERNRLDAYQVNAVGPRNLALVTARLGVPLLHVSTDYVFNGSRREPYHEFERPSPLSVYGASKLAGEEVVRQVNPRHYIVRTSWLYHNVGRNFCRTMIGLSERPCLRVVNDQYGSPTYAPHLAAALTRLIETGVYGTYHLAGQGGASWFELTRELFRRLRICTPLEPVSRAEFPRPAARPVYSVLTTMQSPAIRLPAWQEGVAAFAAAAAA